MEERIWNVKYDHKDGRAGVVSVVTHIKESGAFRYGNNKYGILIVGDYRHGYDLRYNKGDLHKVMINDYFGDGIVEITEI